MSKKITSPVKRWGGSVTIADPLTLPQAMAIEAAIKKNGENEGGKITWTRIDSNTLEAVLPCVEVWELHDFPDNVSLENFPASPRKASHDLVEWLFKEVFAVYLGEMEIPNE